MHERGSVVCESEGGGASMFEEHGVGGSPASLRTVVVVPTAELVGPKRLAPALAADHPVSVGAELERGGAGGEEVFAAADDGAEAGAAVGGDGEGEVEAVDEADAVGGEGGAGAVADGELGEGGGWGAAGAGALEATGAVAGGAGEVVGGAGGEQWVRAHMRPDQWAVGAAKERWVSGGGRTRRTPGRGARRWAGCRARRCRGSC
ncbi:hypothetical protein Sjap_012764 [Stephania japonica]|uniref:Uncharacterized protein n=1 Tax=Stephania japonica TaxID=461633 RepID=A0AAP0IWI1_9MAGN